MIERDDHLVASDLVGVTILAVDDSSDFLYDFSLLLRARNATVVLADNASLALGYLETGRFDVVLTDLAMPEVDGVELLRQIRVSETYGRTPVIAITGFPQCYRAVRDVPFDAFFQKPFEFEELCRAILRVTCGLG